MATRSSAILQTREGDIVVSTRSKSGATWMQMICLLLVLRTPDLPAPLSELSPWLDWLVEPRDQVYERLAAQRHRRVIKTHTPLDGIPLDPGATYVVVGRHPLDAAVSLYHHGQNIDRTRWRELTGQAEPPQPSGPPEPLHDWLLEWVDEDVDPREELDSLPGAMWHLSDAWGRRGEPNVVLVHYEDLSSDLDGRMRDLAATLGIAVPTREGGSGSGRLVLAPQEVARYLRRAASLAPADLLRWLHREEAHREDRLR